MNQLYLGEPHIAWQSDDGLPIALHLLLCYASYNNLGISPLVNRKRDDYLLIPRNLLWAYTLLIELKFLGWFWV